MINQDFIYALIPRSLISEPNKDLAKANVRKDGLCKLKLFWEEGKISEIIPCDNSEFNHKIVLPRFVEVHSHLDKAFTWQRFPNYLGTYQNALSLNLEEHISRKDKDVRFRLDKSLKEAYQNGFRAIRTHIDTSLDLIGLWDTLFDLRNDWKNLIEIQYVALAQGEFWHSEPGLELAKRISQHKDLLGGVISPPIEALKVQNEIRQLILLANKLKLGIDLHIDESDKAPGKGLINLLQVLEEIPSEYPITCSHISSFGLMDQKYIFKIAKKLKKYNINIVSLPLTNFWLLNNQRTRTPISRPIAPIIQLQKSEINVALGRDNVQDSWFPIGGFDPLDLMKFAIPLVQQVPWERLGLSTLTTSPARIMQLSWDGTLCRGCPADLIAFDCDNWNDLLSRNVSRNILVNGKWLSSNFK